MEKWLDGLTPKYPPMRYTIAWVHREPQQVHTVGPAIQGVC